VPAAHFGLIRCRLSNVISLPIIACYRQSRAGRKVFRPAGAKLEKNRRVEAWTSIY